MKDYKLIQTSEKRSQNKRMNNIVEAVQSVIASSRLKNKTRKRRIAERSMTNEFVNFGIHLTLDGYMAEEKKLNDMQLIFKILDELPEQIGMHKLHPPYVITAPPNDKKDPGGISGFVMIAESHISIHTFPKKRFVSIDVYTCQDSMESEKIVSYFKAKLLIKETEINQIKRGLKFPALLN